MTTCRHLPTTGLPVCYNVTPGSLTSWSVRLRRRFHRNAAPISTSKVASRPNVLTSRRRFPTRVTVGHRNLLRPHAATSLLHTQDGAV
jgi:hypothetical protein